MLPQALNPSPDIKGCTIVEMYIKLAVGGVEDPIQHCSVAIMIEINNEELYLWNMLYYYVAISLPLSYMDSVYTHHMYQP